MRKLTLELDSLQVESFSTGGSVSVGTVHGHDTAYAESCAVSLCGGSFCTLPTSDTQGGSQGGDGAPTPMVYTCGGGMTCPGVNTCGGQQCANTAEISPYATVYYTCATGPGNCPTFAQTNC